MKTDLLPEDSEERKKYPLYSGLFHYFPRTCALIARVSWDGSKQHHPDKPMHWDKNKSTDHIDCAFRHAMEGEEANDPYLMAQAAWRLMARTETMLEEQLGEV